MSVGYYLHTYITYEGLGNSTDDLQEATMYFLRGVHLTILYILQLPDQDKQMLRADRSWICIARKVLITYQPQSDFSYYILFVIIIKKSAVYNLSNV